MGKFKFPSAYTILFFLIAVVAVLTWIVPAGQYHMAMNEALGKDVPVAGTYAHVAAHPQGLVSVLMAPIAGLYDPESGQAGAIDVALFILIIGGFLGIVTKTGAIDAGIERVTTRLRGREEWMIPILMALFAAGGTIYGMAEESLPFYTLLVPVMLAARFDPVVAASTVLLGAGIGTLGSTINPFATVIAANAAGIPFTNGIALRVALLVIGWIICVAWVMRYARKVRKDPSLSIVADKQEEIRRDLQERGFETISQSTVSRLLKLLGVIKIRNAKGLKIYSLNPQLRPAPDAARTVSEMVVSVEHNSEFILIHTVAGYGRAVARILDYHQLPEILGVVAGSSIVWVAPRVVKRTALVHKQINYLLRTH